MSMESIAQRGHDLRDSSGRTFTAAAWNGSLDALDAGELSRRADAVADYIGISVTRWDTGSGAFVMDVRPDEIAKWAKVRLDCLNELERRAEEAGMTRVDLVFASDSWKAGLR